MLDPSLLRQQVDYFIKEVWDKKIMKDDYAKQVLDHIQSQKV